VTYIDIDFVPRFCLARQVVISFQIKIGLENYSLLVCFNFLFSKLASILSYLG